VVEGIAGPNPLTNINHGFEIYGQAAGQECVDVLIWHCQSSNCSRGVYAGGEDAGHFAIHTGVVMDGCTYSGNTISDIAGLHGTTVYVDNHTTDPAVEGSVTIRS
jgi:hypothetical protein